MIEVKLKAELDLYVKHKCIIYLIRNVHLQYNDICCLALSIRSIKVPPLKSQCFAALFRHSK